MEQCTTATDMKRAHITFYDIVRTAGTCVAVFVCALCLQAEDQLESTRAVEEMLGRTDSFEEVDIIIDETAFPEIDFSPEAMTLLRMPRDVQEEAEEMSDEVYFDDIEEAEEVPITIPRQIITEDEEEVSEIVDFIDEVDELIAAEEDEDSDLLYEPEMRITRPGALGGRVTSHKGEALRDVQVVLFSDERYHTMRTTPGGSFGFTILTSNHYTLTATYGNEFFYTNVFLVPSKSARLDVQFVTPVTVYGQLYIDDAPAQEGMLLRFISERGAQAGAIVRTNGLFTISRITPGNYIMVCERRRRFIDDRINEQRFYFAPLAITNETMRVRLNRDRRRLRGQVHIDGLPRRYVDAIVRLRDDRTNGLLIYREVPTYYRDGHFEFNHIQPGRYRIQAVQRQGEWASEETLITIPPRAQVRQVTLNVVTDPDAHRKYIDDLKRQFR